MSAAGQPRSDLGPFAGGGHACAFFAGEEDEYQALAPFASDCLACGERCLNFVDPAHRQDRVARLTRGGIAAAEALASGQLEVHTWEETSLQGGSFDQDRMLALIDHLVMQRIGPFRRTRLWADMEWSLSSLPGCEQLVEYESRLNTLLEHSDAVVVCVYDVRQYGASLVMDVLRTHPLVVVDARLRPNPLYMPPQSFLADYRQRRGR